MEKIKRQCNVVMLPTNEKAIIVGNKSYATQANCGELKLRHSMSDSFINSFWKNPWTNYNLHITSDEEIREGDEFITIGDIKGKASYTHSTIKKCLRKEAFTTIEGIRERLYISETGHFSGYNPTGDSNFKKIIASTDPSLGLPQPSTAFIEKYITEYNNGNVIEKVMVEYCRNPYFGGTCGQYIPKVSNDNTLTISKVKDSWNRKEVVRLCSKAWLRVPNTENMLEEFGDWINKNL